jgi:hypothetical protein
VAAVKQRMPFMKSKPLLLGKLRVRLSTVAPGKTWTRALPMLAGRRNGGEHTATAHLSMRVCAKSICIVSAANMAVGSMAAPVAAALMRLSKLLVSWAQQLWARADSPEYLRPSNCRSCTAVGEISWGHTPGRH